MKKLVALVLTLVSISAFAQRDGGRGGRSDGRLDIGDGRSIIRIDIGDDRDDRDMLRRLHRMEQAVRELQDQVYQLSTLPPAPRTIDVYVCSGRFDMVRGGVIIEKASSKTEAQAKVIRTCAQRDNGSTFWCDRSSITCELTQERL